MRQTLRKTRLSVVRAGLLAAVLSVPAQAQWNWIHGNAGVVQEESVISRPCYFGWGLDFVQNAGTWNWVHFGVPSVGQGENGVQYIALSFETGSDDAFISTIDVYDGNINFYSFGGWWTGYNDIVLDLGQNWQIWRGLGISIGFGTGVEAMSHQFKFYSAGAYFSPFSR